MTLPDSRRAALTANELARLAGPAGEVLARQAADGFAGCVLGGKYRLLREVGRGGMGVVYEAEQLDLGRRRVAVKLLPLAGDGDELRAKLLRDRFFFEAEAAAKLHHTHIVPVFDVGVADGVAYYAMQYVDGDSLADVLTRLRPARRASPNWGAALTAVTVPLGGKAVPAAARPAAERPPASSTFEVALADSRAAYFREVARIGIAAAEALDHAHRRGFLHRDIKPANLLLEVGHLWLTDFGLAVLRQRAAEEGRGGGTPGYTSPEQAGVGGGPVGERSDVYSLGATLYELLTLRPAFDGTGDYEIWLADSDPVAPRRRAPGVPTELETVVLKAMAKEPARRYASARELADDLRRFLDHRPILATPPTWGDMLRKAARRNRRVLAASLVTLLVCLAVSSALLLRAYRQAFAASERSRAVLTQFFSDLDDSGNYRGAVGADPQVARLRAAVECCEATIADGSATGRERFLAAQMHWRLAQFLAETRDDRIGAGHGFRRSRDLFVVLASEYPNRPIYRLDAARSLRSLAVSANDIVLMEAALAEVVALAGDHPDDPRFADAVAAYHVTLGQLARGAGRQGLAERHLLEGRERANDLARRHADRWWFFAVNAARAEAELAALAAQRDRPDDARAACARADELYGRIVPVADGTEALYYRKEWEAVRAMRARVERGAGGPRVP